MGIDDHNPLKDPSHNSDSGERVMNLNEIVVIVARVTVLLFLLFIALRMPPVWLKIGGSIAVLALGWRWLLKSTKRTVNLTPFEEGKRAEERQDYRSAIEYYEKALGGTLKPNPIAVRLLVCYDAAGEVGRAKTMIQQIDGSEFPESVAEELETLAANYFPITMEKTQNGVRLNLV